MKSGATSKAGAGCIVLFALPFAATGIGALAGAVYSFRHGASMQQVFFFASFGLVFSMAGFGLTFAALWGHKRLQQDEALRARHPEQPWLWNEEWSSRRIPDRSSSGTAFLWFFAIVWNGIASPAIFLLPRELEQGNYAILIALIFPLLGIMFLGTAVRGTLRALRFHHSTFLIDTLPAPVGGVLRGRVEVPYAPLADARSIVARLTAFSRRRGSKGVDERVVWQAEEELARGSIVRMPDRVLIPIAIPIDASTPPTENYGASADGTVWRLAIDGDLPGVDYSAVFDVPVFRTNDAPSLPHVPHTPPAEPRTPQSFVSTQTAQGRELRFPPFRARSVAFVSLLLFVIWTGFLVVIATTDAPRFFVLLFALFAIPLFLYTLELFFGSSSVTLAADRVIVRRKLFGSKEHVLRRADIAAVETKIGTHTSGSSPRPYYDVEVRTQEGKKIAAAKFIRSKREAEWVAAQIRGAVDSRP